MALLCVRWALGNGSLESMDAKFGKYLFDICYSEAYLGQCLTSMKEFFAKFVDGLKATNIFAKKRHYSCLARP